MIPLHNFVAKPSRGSDKTTCVTSYQNKDANYESLLVAANDEATQSF